MAWRWPDKDAQYNRFATCGVHTDEGSSLFPDTHLLCRSLLRLGLLRLGRGSDPEAAYC
jgi:hypothetical protein